jgi:AhpC/TSA family
MSNNHVRKRAILGVLLALASCTSENEQPVAKAPPAAVKAPVVAPKPAPTPAPAPKAEAPPAFPTLNKLAPEIVGEDIDGKPIKLSDYRGKVVMLDFWGNW